MNQHMKAAGDFELWMRFYSNTEVYCLDSPIGIFRSHEDQLSSHAKKEYENESQNAFSENGGRSLNGMQEWVIEKMCKLIASRLTKALPFLYFRSNIVVRGAKVDSWHIERRLMV